MSLAEQHKAVYICIGQRIRERRKLLKLSQSELAEMMGFSYQQMQKYETGSSHVSASKLLLFAKILNVPPNYFYDGINLEKPIGKRLDSHLIQKTRTEPLHILLIEDNPGDVILFKKSLDRCPEPTKVNVIYDSETVMDVLYNYDIRHGRKSPDIIVLDLSLPRISGMELLKSIKKHPKTLELPVIILTHSVNVKDMVESYREGAAGFIQKCVDISEYEESVAVTVKYWSKTVVLPLAA